MATSTASLTKTLRSITVTKLSAIERKRRTFSRSKRRILDEVSNVSASDAGSKKRLKVSRLLRSIEELDLPSTPDISLSNLDRWLYQSDFDDSVSEVTLQGFEKDLRARLDVQTTRLDLADLYSRLLEEWLNSDNEIGASDFIIEDSASQDLEGTFEVLDSEKERIQHLREKFEAVVFKPLVTDQIAIHNHLEILFKGDGGAKALGQLRQNVQFTSRSRSLNTSASCVPFNDQVLSWCLKGLLASELLSEEKKDTLQEFQQNQVARGEICDVLNMKFADLKNWSWEASEGIPIGPRRQLNGKYRIMMDEDVLEAILLHYVGITWSVAVKGALKDLIKSPGIWKESTGVPQEEVDKRRYYLGDSRSRPLRNKSVEEERQRVYQEDFFLSQMPTSVYEGAGGYDDDEMYDDDDFSRKSPKEIKQQLLRQLATELHLHRALYGEAAIVQSDFQWFGTALPHSTIIAVLRFIGVPEEWINFFVKYLEAPLNMAPVSENPSAVHEVRIRRRGVPMAHALEKFFGELVLFFLDLTVNQESGTLLYRFQDDLWICGKPDQCANGWQSMSRFASVMGLEFNLSKTGSVCLSSRHDALATSIIAKLPKGPVSVGFLELEPSTGDWVINQRDVWLHITQLHKQLAKCTSILSWVQTWNSCIDRFFSHTFGEPANCFGRAHVDSILCTYQAMNRTIFSGKGGNERNITKHIKAMIKARLGVLSLEVPDAFIFLPEQLGGLGVRNPFISCLLVRENIYTSPSGRMAEFLEEERQEYEAARKEFHERGEAGRRRLFHSIFPPHDYRSAKITKSAPIPEDELDSFMSMEEFTRFRCATSASLCRAYNDLMRVPENAPIDLEGNVRDLLRRTSDRRIQDMDDETKWIMQFYAKELVERCGELSCVDRGLLPLGVLAILRRRKVRWGMVL